MPGLHMTRAIGTAPPRAWRIRVTGLDQAKRIVRIVVGFTLLGIGVVLLVLPGPGWLVIAAGLAVLAAEYVWAKRLLDRLKRGAGQLRDAVGRAAGSADRE